MQTSIESTQSSTPCQAMSLPASSTCSNLNLNLPKFNKLVSLDHSLPIPQISWKFTHHCLNYPVHKLENSQTGEWQLKQNLPPRVVDVITHQHCYYQLPLLFILMTHLQLCMLSSVLWHCWLDIRKSICLIKNWGMTCRHGFLSKVSCKWFAYGPVDTTAIPSSLASLKSKLVYLSGAGLPKLPWKRGN